ncbi:hypothetical protein [Paenibacillus validus]
MTNNQNGLQNRYIVDDEAPDDHAGPTDLLESFLEELTYCFPD